MTTQEWAEARARELGRKLNVRCEADYRCAGKKLCRIHGEIAAALIEAEARGRECHPLYCKQGYETGRAEGREQGRREMAEELARAK